MKKITSKDISKAIALYEAGASQQEIGLILGVSGQLIGRYIRSAGIETCIGGYNEKRSQIKNKHLEILRRYERGESKNAIARSMKMSVSGVTYAIEKKSSRPPVRL